MSCSTPAVAIALTNCVSNKPQDAWFQAFATK